MRPDMIMKSIIPVAGMLRARQKGWIFGLSAPFWSIAKLLISWWYHGDLMVIYGDYDFMSNYFETY